MCLLFTTCIDGLWSDGLRLVLLYARGCVFVDNPKWEVPGKRVLVNGVSTSRHTFERSRRGRVGHGGGLCAADSRLLVGDYVGFGGLPVSRRPSGAERHELVHLWNVGLQGGACPRSRDIHQGSCTSIPWTCTSAQHTSCTTRTASASARNLEFRCLKGSACLR